MSQAFLIGAAQSTVIFPLTVGIFASPESFTDKLNTLKTSFGGDFILVGAGVGLGGRPCERHSL